MGIRRCGVTVVLASATCFSNPQTIWGLSLKALWSVGGRLGSAIFLVTLACLDVSSKKSCHRDILHIILKHTQ